MSEELRLMKKIVSFVMIIVSIAFLVRTIITLAGGVVEVATSGVFNGDAVIISAFMPNGLFAGILLVAGVALSRGTTDDYEECPAEEETSEPGLETDSELNIEKVVLPTTDWECLYCGGLNSESMRECPSCGGLRINTKKESSLC